MGASRYVETGGFTGGCQCGAVRFEVAAGPARHTICWCAQCRRQSGAPFAPLVEVKTERVKWTGIPAAYRSSNIAERGYCAACGTPLYYRQTRRDSTELFWGAITSDYPFAPVASHFTQNRPDWALKLAEIPAAEFHAPEGVEFGERLWTGD